MWPISVSQFEKFDLSECGDELIDLSALDKALMASRKHQPEGKNVTTEKLLAWAWLMISVEDNTAIAIDGDRVAGLSTPSTLQTLQRDFNIV